MPKGYYIRTPEHLTMLKIKAEKMRSAINHGSTCDCASCKGQRGDYRGTKNPRWGMHLSEDLKKRISVSEKGKKVVVTDEHRQNLSKATKGKPKIWLWKGGRPQYSKRHPLLYAIRNSDRYQKWRDAVCAKHGISPTYKGIQIHHLITIVSILKANSVYSFEDALKCEELWNIDNGVPLMKGEHYIISCMERRKRISKGFVTLIEQWLAKQQVLDK